METKDLAALILLFLALPVGVAACSLSQRARDLAFFLLITTTVLTDKMDVNFLSHFWYRGTTRGVEISFVDLLAISLLVGTLLAPGARPRRWYWPAGFGLMLCLFLYQCMSVVFAEPRVYGLFELSKTARGLIVFLAAAFFVRGRREVLILAFGLCCAICFEGALAVKERLLYGVYRATGSLEHANSFSMYLCGVAPVILAIAASPFPKLLRTFAVAGIAAATLSIVLTVSRAGMPTFALAVGGAAAFCISWRITLRKVACVAVIVIFLAGLLAKSWDTLAARYAEATLEEEYLDESGEGRGYYLRLARLIVNDNVFGVGLNNWSYAVSKKYGALLGTPYEDYDQLEHVENKDDVPNMNFAAPAHNLGALTIGELGLPGLLIFALVWLRWFMVGAHFLWRRIPADLYRMGVGIFFGTLGIFLQSLTEWTYRQTHIMFTFHLLLGTLASLYWLQRRARPQPMPARFSEPVGPVPYEAVSA